VGRTSGVFKVRIQLDEGDVKAVRRMAKPGSMKIRDYLEKRFDEYIRGEIAVFRAATDNR
jgi:hypothetical protein